MRARASWTPFGACQRERPTVNLHLSRCADSNSSGTAVTATASRTSAIAGDTAADAVNRRILRWGSAGGEGNRQAARYDDPVSAATGSHLKNAAIETATPGCPYACGLGAGCSVPGLTLLDPLQCSSRSCRGRHLVRRPCLWPRGQCLRVGQHTLPVNLVRAGKPGERGRRPQCGDECFEPAVLRELEALIARRHTSHTPQPAQVIQVPVFRYVLTTVGSAPPAAPVPQSPA